MIDFLAMGDPKLTENHAGVRSLRDFPRMLLLRLLLLPLLLHLPLRFPSLRACGSRESKASAAAAAREKEKRQPKYIGNLLQQAKLRSIQSDRVYERKLQKEREEQDKVRTPSVGRRSASA